MIGVVKALAIILVALVAAFPAITTWADGSEQLGPPSVPITEGSGVIAAGVGLWGGVGIMGSGDITFTVPQGAEVQQVFLYWAGREGFPDSGQKPEIPPEQSTIQVNGENVTGSKIGEVFLIGPDDIVVAYRADITEMDLVARGDNALTIAGEPFVNFINSGAGVIVIVDDGDGAATVSVVDGVDSAYASADPPGQKATVPQTFNFEPQDAARTAELTLLVTEVRERATGPEQRFRKSNIVVDVGGNITRFPNVLQSHNGAAWDTHTLTIEIPADASSLTVHVDPNSAAPAPSGFSGSAPAALQWIAAALVVPGSNE